MKRDRTQVAIVAGAPGSGKSRLIAQLRAHRPAREKWAYLGNSGTPELPGADLQVPPDQRFTVAGGCACCLAGPVLRTTLVRLLRAGPWHRLHIEVDPQGHPRGLTDQLRQPPFDQYLQVAQLLLTLRGDEKPEELRAVPGPLEWATDYLVRSGLDAGRIDGCPAGLNAAPPWPRAEHAGPSGRAESDLLQELQGWRHFGLGEGEPGGAHGAVERSWPPEVIFERRSLKTLLEALVNEPGVEGVQATMRTPRAWYAWRFGRGRGSGPCGFDAGDRLVEAETGWRLDSRVAVWLGPGAHRASVLSRVQELERY